MREDAAVFEGGRTVDRNSINYNDSTANHGIGASTESVANSRMPWHCPIVTVIDLKRTMNGAGYGSDGTAHTS